MRATVMRGHGAKKGCVSCLRPVYQLEASRRFRPRPTSGEPMSNTLRVVVACITLAGLAACAAPPPPPPVLAPPPAKPLDAKTQLENHM